MTVYTAGVWDLLHEGHLNALEASAAQGHRLIVGVVSDKGVAAYKDRPPVQSETTRLRVIRSLRIVDWAVIQPTTDPTPILEALRPDVMTHADDWPRLLQGHETLERLGIRWAQFRYTPGVSTTLLRGRL